MVLTPIILAAGKGTRMNSTLPKVLHTVGGITMLDHVVHACKKISSDQIIIIYGHGGERVRKSLDHDDLTWVEQSEQLGTGHAVSQAQAEIKDSSTVIIAYGDVPLITEQTLTRLSQKIHQCDLAVLTTILDNPTGYGRIIRDDKDTIQAIVEEKDATDSQRVIKEINTGFIAAKGKNLKRWLEKIKPNNNQGEYYLTDCIAFAANEGLKVESVICEDPIEVQGVNDRIQQAEIERAYQAKKVNELMLAGVTLLDPARVDIRGDLYSGKDVSIDVNTIFIGKVELGDRVKIESGCVITDSKIKSDTTVKANSVVESAKIGSHCDVGPFARIRPETVIKSNAKVGNFVEIKKSTIGDNSKVSHLSYIGDTTMGDNVNIGAGTITCNYDGANKFQTIIGDNVFIGSDTQLVAPVTVNDGATIGAGSTIVKSVPMDELTLSRAKQVTINGWKRPIKNK